METTTATPSLAETLERLARREPVRLPVISLYLNARPDSRGKDNYAAFLRKEGYKQVDVLTARPGRLLLRWERGVVRDVCGDRGLALIVDDPPETGNAIADVVTRLRRLGLPEASVVLLLQLLEGQDIPSALRGYASVCLAWSSWAVHERLAPGGRCYVLLSSDSDLEYLGRLMERARFRARVVEERSILVESFILYELRPA